jgi:hypothetical protein
MCFNSRTVVPALGLKAVPDFAVLHMTALDNGIQWVHLAEPCYNTCCYSLTGFETVQPSFKSGNLATCAESPEHFDSLAIHTFLPYSKDFLVARHAGCARLHRCAGMHYCCLRLRRGELKEVSRQRCALR